MPRGIKKESSETTKEKVPETWENALIVGNFSSNKKAWQALVTSTGNGTANMIPNVVRLGRKWYTAYFIQTEDK